MAEKGTEVIENSLHLFAIISAYAADRDLLKIATMGMRRKLPLQSNRTVLMSQ